MAALVREDGSAAGSSAWLQRAGLPHHAPPGTVGWNEPLRTTLSLSRSCDRLVTVRLLGVGNRHRQVAGECTMDAVPSPAGVPQFHIDVRDDGDVHHVRLAGEIDHGVAPELESRLLEIAGSLVDVDLSDVTFLDARGLGALLRARQRVTEAGHEFRLRGAHGIVRRVFAITDLDHLLEDT
jgi:anti-anti-sigma factor